MPEALLNAPPEAEVEYVPDPANIISAEAARDWGSEVSRIFREHGTTGPVVKGDQALQVVLDEASSPESPLHGYLEWDDSVAGHKYRLGQCRHFINHVYVRVIHNDEPVMVRALVNVVQSNGNGRSYKPVQDVDADEGTYLVKRARAELSGWRQRYTTYSHIAEISRLVGGVGRLLE